MTSMRRRRTRIEVFTVHKTFTVTRDARTTLVTKEDSMIEGNILGLALPIGLGIAAVGSGLGLGKAVGAAMEAMGR
jgi:hypothetical protein